MSNKSKIRIYIISLAVLLSVVFAVSYCYAGRVELPEGQEVKVKFDSKVPISSGELKKGVPVQIQLVEPIEVGDVVIVEKGAPGTAVVSEVAAAGKPGKAGKIKVDFTELEPKGDYQSADNSKIKISGQVEKKGKGKKLLSFILGFGFFIKGGQGVIKTDSVYTATITEPIILESK